MNEDKVLGKKVGYCSKYNPDLLVFVPRKEKRDEIGITSLPFIGFDLWNQYEISYLDYNGKPVVRIATLIYNANTDNIVESKSLKLYFNSFNMTHIKSDDELKKIIEDDLKKGLNDPYLQIVIYNINEKFLFSNEPKYRNIDNYDINTNIYQVDNNLLKKIEGNNEQMLCSDLLKSNCLVTKQPDWGSVYISIIPNGYMIDEISLLKYIISFRQHNEFHEQCIERIFNDLNNLLNPKYLSVFGKYVRRGGIDINPYREKYDTGVYNKMKNSIFYRGSRQ